MAKLIDILDLRHPWPKPLALSLDFVSQKVLGGVWQKFGQVDYHFGPLTPPAQAPGLVPGFRVARVLSFPKRHREHMIKSSKTTCFSFDHDDTDTQHVADALPCAPCLLGPPRHLQCAVPDARNPQGLCSVRQRAISARCQPCHGPPRWRAARGRNPGTASEPPEADIACKPPEADEAARSFMSLAHSTQNAHGYSPATRERLAPFRAPASM